MYDLSGKAHGPLTPLSLSSPMGSLRQKRPSSPATAHEPTEPRQTSYPERRRVIAHSRVSRRSSESKTAAVAMLCPAKYPFLFRAPRRASRRGPPAPRNGVRASGCGQPARLEDVAGEEIAGEPEGAAMLFGPRVAPAGS